MKVCSKCQETKPLTEFHKDSGNPDGYRYDCKNCRNGYVKKFSQRRREASKKWYNKEDNQEIKKKSMREWREKNPDYFQEYFSEPHNHIRKRLSNRLNDYVKGRNKRNLNFVGCSFEELKHYLESQFTDGMNWENYGDVWHIDHEIPCSKFDLTDPHQQAVCFHWSNLQPMLAEENLRKSNNIKIFKV